MSYLYKPSPWGAEFHALPHREALGAGSAGPGKTTVLIHDPLYQVFSEHNRMSLPRSHPHFIERGASEGWALHLRRVLPMLQQTLRKAKYVFTSVDPDGKWSEGDLTYTFSSGYRYQFGHCRDSDSWELYFSNEYTYIAYDELVQFEEEQYNMINARLRTSDPALGGMLKIRAMSNPVIKIDDGSFNIVLKNPHWVRDRFVAPAPMGRVNLYEELVRQDGTTERVDRIYLPARLFDNPDPGFVRRYELELLRKPLHIRKAMLDGDWYHVPDSYFGQAWDPGIHVCRPFAIPDEWPQFRMMDWGFKMPGAVYWAAMDPDGNMFVHREHTFQGKDVGVVAKEIKDIEIQLGLWSKARNCSRVTGPADTQLWEERGDIGKSKAAEFADRGIVWCKADKRSRARSAQLLLSRLEDHRNRTVTPGIVFFSHCHQIIKTLPGIPASPKNPEEPIDGGDDHWLDAVCYGVSYASLGDIGMARDKAEDDEDRIPERPRSTGGFGYGANV